MRETIMTPRERVFRRLNGERVDKIPNLNILMQYAAKTIGVGYKTYVTDYRRLVEGNIICCEKYGIDMVSAISDPMREVHGYGADVTMPEDDVPYCKAPLIQDISDIPRLKPLQPMEDERTRDRINAVALYHKEVGETYPILGWVEGAYAEAADLRGVNDIMMDLYDEPEAVHDLLDICTEGAIAFALEQITAGADIIGIGDAAASLIGPKGYAEFALPYEKKIIEAIHKAGAKARLHICGNISPILDTITLSGADIIDVDYMVDFAVANKAFAGKCCACGNFDPVAILLQGSVGQVKEAVNHCVAVGNEHTFIAAGCEVPRMTPMENLMAVDEALKQLRVDS